MAKDPAVLWYWNDWHSGTILMSRFLKGCYIDILHAQFNHGPLSLEEIKTCLGSDFGSSWPAIQKKFKQTEEGLFFNERMECEKVNRKKNSQHQRDKALKRWHKSGNAPASAPAMPLENESENEDEIKIFSIEKCIQISLYDSRFVKANKTNEHELLMFNKYLEKTGKYKMIPIDYKKYFSTIKDLYPHLLKKEYTIEELKEIAKKIDQENDKQPRI
jgi:hypothetical protein